MKLSIYVSVCLIITVIAEAGEPAPIDPNATAETKALFHNLRKQMGKGILFGHQNTTLYGVGWHAKDGVEKGRSDVKSACGQYPAVYGWDLNTIWRPTATEQEIEKRMPLMRGLVVEAYEQGGVNTFSWHMWNPITRKNFYDTTPAMAAIVPGGKKHEWYRQELDRAAALFTSLKTKDGTLVPVIFRPFHEQNLKCFWWCIRHSNQKVYNQVFRFTVTYLRDEKGVHNLLYAAGPSGVKGPEEYMQLIPGAAYVDLFGFDKYADSNKDVLSFCRAVVGLAEKHGKIAAMTEGGFRKGIAKAPADYYTKGFLAPFRKDPVASRIAYALVWQNTKAEQHWIPVKGDKQFDDFRKFSKDPLIIFGDRIPSIYGR